jgi:hypothetical protein
MCTGKLKGQANFSLKVYRPARLDLHESGTIGWIGIDKDITRYRF